MGEEPEWFSAGPTSQMDTIELRGFEESPHHSSSAERDVTKRDAAAASDAADHGDTQTSDAVHDSRSGDTAEPERADAGPPAGARQDARAYSSQLSFAWF